MKKTYYFIYGLFAYGVALVGQIWFILYLSQWDAMHRTITMAQTSPLSFALLIDIVLVLLWGVQHSMMARGWFKEKWTQLIPDVIERSTYVLFSGIVMLAIVFFWQPIDGVLWNVPEGILREILWGGFIFGWVFSVVATFVINHFELFGLQQVYLHLRHKSTPEQDFTERLFYKFIRHPIQLGVLIGLWVTPIMSYGHLLLSVLMTIYIFIGLYYEEKDLLSDLGESYEDYRKRVGMMFPKVRK